MKTTMIALALALVTAAVPAAAKTKNKAVTGCVEHKGSSYQLSEVTKKGKTKHYTLVGDHDFAGDVGHRVRVNGVVGKATINAGSVSTVAKSCDSK
jgi:hypothetical protein